MSAYLSIEGVAGISFFLVCLILVLFHARTVRRFQSIDFAIMSMGFIYGAFFPLVVHNALAVNVVGANFISASRSFSLVHTGAALIAVAGIYLGWRALPRRQHKRLSLFFSEVRVRNVIFWLYVMTVIAIITQYLYAMDYGGFLGYFDFNRLVRAGLFDLFERSRFSFLRPFGGMGLIACFGFWGLILSGKHGFPVWLGFSLSLMVSVYFLLASAGRVSMLVFFAVLLMSVMLARRTNYLVWFFSVLLFVPVSLVAIFWLSDLFALKAGAEFTSFVSKEASFPFVSFFAQLNSGYLFNAFLEVMLAPAYLLPSSLTYSWLWSAADINTELVMGSPKGVAGNTTGIPTDMITFGLMQFHIFGVFGYAFMYGYFLRAATAVAGSFALSGLSAVFVSYVMLRIGAFGIFYSHPQHIIMTNFAAIAVVLFAVGMRLLRRRTAMHPLGNNV